MESHILLLNMYTKISGEFETVEFAETAARYIRERTDGHKKIIIYKNKSKFKGCANSTAEIAAVNGNTTLIYPFSTHSNNFMSGMTVRKVDESQINELLRTESVRMEVICEKKSKEKALQYMISCGGYNINS